MTQHKGESIESMQIRGITLRGIIAIIACTVSIVTTSLTTYFSLRGDLRSLREKNTQDEKYNDLRIKSIELNITLLERRVNRTSNEDIKETVRETLKEIKQ